jgi:hypothetical protein
LKKNVSRKLRCHQNPTRLTGTLHEDISTFMTICRWILFKMINVLDRVVEIIRWHILCRVTFSRKSCRLWGNVEKYSGAREAAGGNTRAQAYASVHAPTRVHSHTHMCNTHCFSTTTMVSRTRLIVRLYVHSLACFTLSCYIESVRNHLRIRNWLTSLPDCHIWGS